MDNVSEAELEAKQRKIFHCAPCKLYKYQKELLKM